MRKRMFFVLGYRLGSLSARTGRTKRPNRLSPICRTGVRPPIRHRHSCFFALAENSVPASRRSRNGGAGGIRTLDTAFQPYNGLANRRLQPLGHSTASNSSLRDQVEGLASTYENQAECSLPSAPFPKVAERRPFAPDRGPAQAAPAALQKQ